MNLKNFNGVGIAKDQVNSMVINAIQKSISDGKLTPNADLKEFVVEIPQDLSYGDFSTNAAMVN